MKLWTIYDHPDDHPDSFAVREWTIGNGTTTPGTVTLAPTLYEARLLVPAGKFPIGRDDTDDPKIVETWL